ncbi:hypothetical protein HYC85_010601 [Camellia sinensis]|uniref:3-hydroxyisobutyryl-CoA hydrolase n=1 Tax=Camellia sinensis TaxID=4442 RepID=A0A7J7HJQ1_CAMSI|nr:hypothetical protein HYC85_010601 [Camellia sinensis]
MCFRFEFFFFYHLTLTTTRHHFSPPSSATTTTCHPPATTHLPFTRYHHPPPPPPPPPTTHLPFIPRHPPPATTIHRSPPLPPATYPPPPLTTHLPPPSTTRYHQPPTTTSHQPPATCHPLPTTHLPPTCHHHPPTRYHPPLATVTYPPTTSRHRPLPPAIRHPHTTSTYQLPPLTRYHPPPATVAHSPTYHHHPPSAICHPPATTTTHHPLPPPLPPTRYHPPTATVTHPHLPPPPATTTTTTTIHSPPLATTRHRHPPTHHHHPPPPVTHHPPERDLSSRAPNSEKQIMEPINYSNGDADQVLLEDYSYGRKVLLNRPKQLNALSFQMVSRLLELFLASEEDCNVKLIILKITSTIGGDGDPKKDYGEEGNERLGTLGGSEAGVTSTKAALRAEPELCVAGPRVYLGSHAMGKGRAFSAGGDVAAVVRDIKGNWKLGAKFFQKEFILNYVMATYSKPQVSILNGIVMGGGAGASIHGRFRVATENSVFAMPETALGLFPDVGEYVGLTGSRLDGAEMLACGLATHFVSSVRLSLLEEALCKVNSSDPDIISATIHEFSQQPSLKEKSSYNRLDIINKCFSRRTVEEIIFALEREAVNSTDNWISSTIKSLKTASPTSLKISLRSIREGRVQGVGQCLVREYRIVCNIMDGQVSKDFFEWEPSKLVLVSDEMVDRYFSKVDDKDWEDLKLPVRSNLPGHASRKAVSNILN